MLPPSMAAAIGGRGSTRVPFGDGVLQCQDATLAGGWVGWVGGWVGDWRGGLFKWETHVCQDAQWRVWGWGWGAWGRASPPTTHLPPPLATRSCLHPRHPTPRLPWLQTPPPCPVVIRSNSQPPHSYRLVSCCTLKARRARACPRPRRRTPRLPTARTPQPRRARSCSRPRRRTSRWPSRAWRSSPTGQGRTTSCASWTRGWTSSGARRPRWGFGSGGGACALPTCSCGLLLLLRSSCPCGCGS